MLPRGMARLKRWLASMTNMSIETANALFAAANLAAIIGGVLVVIGTAGIFFVGGIREQYADRQRAELAAHTANAQKDAATAQERAAKSNEVSERLRLELERERTERLKLEERLAPRRVSEPLRQQLKQVRPDQETKLRFEAAIDNPEGDRLINEIASALLDAGWPRDRLDGCRVVGSSFPDGVSVFVNPAEGTGGAVPPTAVTLVGLLHFAGLASKTPLIADDSVPAGTIKIAAGFKPGRDA